MKPLLISYVVDHDNGYAPNPAGGICVLGHCKYSKTGKRKNLIEIAEEGVWVVGTGGKGQKSAGSGRVVYAMRVEKKLPINQFFESEQFAQHRACFGKYGENIPGKPRVHGEWVLVAEEEFYYFGRDAVKIPQELQNFKGSNGNLVGLEMGRQGYKYKVFTETFVQAFEKWLRKFKRGINAPPKGWPPERDAEWDSYGESMVAVTRAERSGC